MKRKTFFIGALVLVFVLALFAFTACNNAESEEGVNLVTNGDFSSFTSENKFEGWSTSSSSTTFAKVQRSDSETGDNVLKIENKSAGYNYLKQTVKVEVNKIYKVTVDMKIDAELSNKQGAYVSFLENVEYKFVARSQKTNGFVKSTFYVKPKNTDYLTVALCIGSTENNCKGTVYFDNVNVSRVSSVPDGFELVNFRKAKTVNTSADVNGICFTVLMSLFGVALLACAYVLIRRLYARKDAFTDFGKTTVFDKKTTTFTAKWYQSDAFIVSMILLGAAAIRLVILLTMYGMGSEMTNVLSVARKYLGVNNGVFDFAKKMTSAGNTVTYSPGVIYILSVLGFIGQGLDDASLSILLRLINVVADLAVIVMIYFYGKKQVGNKLATIYASVYAMLPFALMVSGHTATFESLLVALIVGALILMINKKYISTYFVMTLAAVLDLRALAIAPIVVAYFVYMYIKDNDDKKKFTSNRAKIVFGLPACFVLAYALTIPCAIQQIAAGDAFYGFKLMMGQMTNVNYFVKDAFNLYGMVGMNGKSSQQSVNILNLIFLLVLEAYVISLYFKNRNKQELLLLASFTLAVIAVFTIKVTYTYLFLAIALAFIFTMVSGDKRMYFVTSGMSLLGFLNYAQLMNQSGFVKSGVISSAITSFETTGAFYITFCVLSVILIGYYAYVSYSITNNTKIVDIKAMPESFGATLKSFFKGVGAKLKKEDVE